MILMGASPPIDVFSGRTLLLFATLLIATTMSVAVYDAHPYKMPLPLNSIQGTYAYKMTKMSDLPPVLATFWKVDSGDFSIVSWPPKHCQAIHAYFIESKYTGTGGFHVIPEMTDNSPFVKIYPPIGLVELKTEPAGEPVKGYNQLATLTFRQSSGLTFDVQLGTKYVEKMPKYKDREVNTYQIDMNNRIILLVTNSRFCHAHVSKDSRDSDDYFAILDPDLYANADKLVKYLTTYEEPDGIKTLFKPQVNLADSRKKLVDLLPILKGQEILDPSKMRRLPKCILYDTRTQNPLKLGLGRITVDSWSANNANMQVQGGRYQRFIVQILGECSWLRIWIPEQGKTMADYDATMKLEDTIDIFLDQQVMVGPDSDEARPIFGEDFTVHQFVITKHVVTSQSPPTEEKVISVAYGDSTGPAARFVEYFHMPRLVDSTEFQINLIKAPNCKAALVAETDHLGSASPSKINLLQLQSCTRSVLKNMVAANPADDI